MARRCILPNGGPVRPDTETLLANGSIVGGRRGVVPMAGILRCDGWRRPCAALECGHVIRDQACRDGRRPPATRRRRACLAVPKRGGCHQRGRPTLALPRLGRSTDPSLLLTHGVGSSARSWWRVGPATAAAGRRVVAIDMPGHGQAAAWDGRHRFAETAADLAGFIRSAGLQPLDLTVVGHSWVAVVAAHLPQVGARPAKLVLLDPPWLTLEQLETLTLDPSERRYEPFDEARAAVRANNPDWSEGDVVAKAHALTEYDPECVRAVLVRNGPYDAGMSALCHRDAQGIPVWLIHGEWSAGGCIPDDKLPAVRAQVGPDRVMAIAGDPFPAPNSSRSHRPRTAHARALRSMRYQRRGRSVELAG